MVDADVSPLRCLVATVALGRASVRDDVAQLVIDELHAAEIRVVRGVTVNREKEFITQLVMNVASSNEADAIVLIGGAGLGPRDYTCEAVNELADRRMEGFGEAYRRLLFEASEGGVGAVVSRATAGVCNGCVVLAIPRQPAATMRRAMRNLVVPVLPEAMRIAVGVLRPPTV